jgi:hypothetical protein
MSETMRNRLSWLFVGAVAVAAVMLLGGGLPAGASGDHEVVRELREGGEILSLSALLDRESLQGMRVLEAELEREQGRMVYELELLDARGRVIERYFDAITGEPLGRDWGD